MTARRFDLLLTWLLLAFGIWYGVSMLQYPDDAGLVPAIAAAVMVAALVVQLFLVLRKRDGEHHPMATGGDDDAVEHTPVDAVPHAPDGTAVLTDLTAVRHAVEEQEFEQDSYETLIALHGVRRRRFIAISLFTVLFYVGYILVGFVVTTGVLMAAILLAARERPHVVVIGALVGAGSAYALVVTLLGIPAMSGYLVP